MNIYFIECITLDFKIIEIGDLMIDKYTKFKQDKTRSYFKYVFIRTIFLTLVACDCILQ